MSMEVALVSVATGVLKPVLEKLATLLGNEYKRFKGVHKEIKSLSHELAAMEAFLLKMSEEEEDLDVQDKVWMNEVRELSYDMEDAIDEFTQSVGDKDEKPDDFIEKIKHSVGKLGKMKARRRIGKEIQDLKKQITEAGKRNARYRTGVAISNTINATVDPRALSMFEHASNLVGIDEPKAELIKLLAEEEGCMVSIVGSGGMGKTALANQVYQELKGQYKCRAFISVSRNPNITNILRTILGKVSNQPYADTEEGSVQQLIIKITEFLLDKKYFIVVDDIWDTDTWDVIKHVFPPTGFGSRIITTTRINDVAQSCCSFLSGHVYRMKPLNMVHSRQLFHRRLFNSKEDCPSYLKEISCQILKKCDGLPLAIIAISGLLANKEKKEYIWNQVKDSIGRALERNPTIQVMMKILALSYFDLPPSLKTCFLYLSIFPEDSVIKRKGLIKRWIGEGFIHKDDIYTAEEIGEMCFNELINRNLIQPGEFDKYNKVMNCRVHDTILDFIISKSVEENFVTLVGVPYITIGTERKVRRISLQVGKKGNCITSMSQELCQVRSLNVFGNSALIPSLDEFRHLRILDFEGCRELQKQHLAKIGSRLFQLRHLNLRKTRVSELPGQIGHLGCLEMLDLRGTSVRELPASIVNLGRLIHLFVGIRVKFPVGIAKMQALETLKRVCVIEQPFNFLQELGQLKNLRKLVLYFGGDASSYVERETRAKKDLIASSLGKLGILNNVSSLTIWKDECIFLVEPWCTAPFDLQKLMDHEQVFQQVPNWVGSHVCLQEVLFKVEGFTQEDVCNLGSLPALLILNLTVTARGKDRLIVSDAVGFPCLRELRYHRVQFGGMDLLFAPGSMPKLEKLDIGPFNAGESDSLSSESFDLGIGNLPSLISLKCEVRGWLSSAVSAARAYLEKTARTHPNRPSLLLA
ncbi:disease resistance protein RGA5-like [Triticum dicoccoides]|uniref:Sr13 n=1 Tax=Triticum turgidum subsp. durum TaxID=4567 RepID=A0A9R0YZC2_TRITD|nr:disease resistance protein RGA5-like [Triticum dicoccoides]XP_037455223.1 disease resistance protein RGA5-like [Triticum dicoccoides]VAI63670.1 unnamed protein product [Triticum turgidum subsp. durum]